MESLEHIRVAPIYEAQQQMLAVHRVLGTRAMGYITGSELIELDQTVMSVLRDSQKGQFSQPDEMVGNLNIDLIDTQSTLDDRIAS